MATDNPTRVGIAPRIDVHPSLRHQLEKLGLTTSEPPDHDGWSMLLAELNRLFEDRTGDRRRFSVSTALSAAFDDPEAANLFDAATGLPNQSGLVVALKDALRGVDGADSAVLLVSLQGLGRVAGRLGEHGGVEVLLNAGARIQQMIRNVDVVARLDGDEFAVLLGGLASPDSIRTVTRRIERGFTEPVVAAGHHVYLTVHVGAALARPGSSAADALKRSRTALEATRSLNAKATTAPLRIGALTALGA